jgi:restriction system protein
VSGVRFMGRVKKIKCPTYTELIIPTFEALKELGGSGTNDEICTTVINNLKLSDEAVDEAHLGSNNQSELQYQLAWARTYMKNFGVILNSARSVWSISSKFTSVDKLNVKEIIAFTANKSLNKHKNNNEDINFKQPQSPEDNNPENNNIEFPDEIKPWRKQLAEVLHNMNPFAFERLAQRLLRECGFTQVVVTKKTNDGGIDGTGKLRINGIFSFNVAFQCKRYNSAVSAGDIRDFRGSLTTDIEKGVFITTGTFTKSAKEEASNAGKQQIDLIDGEDFINKIAEYEIGVKEIKDYEIDEDFFKNI